MTISISNGAANWAFAIAKDSKPSLEDLFTSGNLCRKLKPAKNVPPPEEGEKQGAYQARIDEWLDTQFGEVELSTDEYDYIRTVLRALLKANSIQGNEYVAEFAVAIGLDKKQPATPTP